MWLGGTDATNEGTWLWEDGTSADLTLPSTAPDPGSINPDYLRLSKDGDCEAEDGQQKYPFFCEVKLGRLQLSSTSSFYNTL